MKARITVRAGTCRGPISRNIYGVMFENCGRCLYDGLWVGEAASVPNWNGVRCDMLKLLTDAATPIVRWPGGTPSDRHHWRNGIGPRAARPVSMVSGGEFGAPPESYAFGTDEYLALSRKVGFEPYICTNVGTGCAEEAAEWVEYCNCAAATSLTALREANGRTEPYGVRYWGIGNECYFWYDAHAYARVLRHYAKLMRHVDPTITLVGAGRADCDEWNETVLAEAGDAIDAISAHFFYGTHGTPEGQQPDGNFLARPLHAEQSIRRLQDQIRRIVGPERMRIVVDEWAVWNREARPETGAEQNLALRDALFAAGMFHMFHRTRDIVDMGIVANLVNSTNMVLTDGDRICVSPAAHALQLYATRAGDTLVDSQVEVPGYQVEFLDRPVPWLDVSVTRHTRRNNLIVAAVNRHTEREIQAELAVSGCRLRPQGRVFEINAESLDAANTFDVPDRIVVTEKSAEGLGEGFSYTFPAHSISLLEIPICD